VRPLTEPYKRAFAVPAATVERERVEWLWPGRIPLGSVSLLVGDPGLGKSLLTCELAARGSREGRVTLIATAEDSLAVTVRPRLEAAEADLHRVAFLGMQAEDGLPAGLCLPHDADELARLVEAEDAELLVIDPLTAHLPAEVNSWRDQSVRLALAPLHGLAERQRCAVLAVVHLNKALSAEPLRRIGGSIGIPAAARSVLLLARDPDDDGQRVLAHVKCNVAPQAPSLVYVLDPIVLPAVHGAPAVETVRLREVGESAHRGSDLLSAVSGGDPEERSARDEAVAFLRDELSEGARPAKEIQEAARDAGVSRRTLERAKQKLRVESVREGGIAASGIWLWRLPEGSLSPPSDVANLGHRHSGGLSESRVVMRPSEQEALSPPTPRYGVLTAGEGSHRVPIPGDEGYLRSLDEALARGLITERERRERRVLDRVISRTSRAPAGEPAVIAELNALAEREGFDAERAVGGLRHLAEQGR
jgi:AAA domain